MSSKVAPSLNKLFLPFSPSTSCSLKTPRIGSSFLDPTLEKVDKCAHTEEMQASSLERMKNEDGSELARSQTAARDY